MQRIAAIWSHLRLLLRSRLSRRVGAAVFLSIFAIEAIILLPSYRNYERDLLAGLEREGRATIKSLFRFGYHADPAEFERAGAMVIRDSRLIGGALYRFFGSAATQFGDPPTLLPNVPSNSEIVRKRSADGRHYDVIWPGSGIAFGSVYAVAVRLDTSWVAGELVAFVWRIAGLALLISCFVTLVTMIIVGRRVIVPILRLRQNLAAAAADPRHPDRYTIAERSKDELGEVMAAFNKMLTDVALTQRQEIERVVAMTENGIAGNFAFSGSGELVYCNKAGLALCSAADARALDAAGYPRLAREPAGQEVGLFDYLKRDAFVEEILLEVSPGRRVPCLVSGNHVAGGDGRSVLYFASVLDVTEMHAYRKRLETTNIELEAASRAKSEFLANMSHELRTPLNAIIGFSEIMQAELFGPLGGEKYTQYAEDIHNSGTHLLAIISDILDLSKIEADKQELYEEAIDLAEVFEASLRIVRERAKSAGVALGADAPPELPLLFADERMIKQILLNLLSNAIKFTPDGGEVALRAALEDGALSISVRDTGIGMDDFEVAQALEPFGQVENFMTRSHEGAGLGLPLVKAFVGLHGGSLVVDSVKGVGTTVTVRFGADRVRRAAEVIPLEAKAS